MTRSLVLVWADSETGEVMNSDGTSSSVIVPKVPVASRWKFHSEKWQYGDGPPWFSDRSGYTREPLLSARKVDLSGAAVKLPEKKPLHASDLIAIGNKQWNACLYAILATKPKGE